MNQSDDASLRRKRGHSHHIEEPPEKKRIDGESEELVLENDLVALLDLSALTSHVQVDSRFRQIASVLLQNYYLVCSSPNEQCTFEVLEIEFYLIKPRTHEDPFTHGNDEQKDSGRWYFHRAPRRSNTTSLDETSQRVTATAAGGYRGGTRKGLDLTFGGRVSLSSRHFPPTSTLPRVHLESTEISDIFDPPRGGILLRSLRRVSDGAVISGPSLLVDEILRINGASSVAELVAEKWNGDTSALQAVPGCISFPWSGRFSLVLESRGRRKSDRCTHTSTQISTRIYRSPRIGLDLSNPGIPTNEEDALRHPRVIFVFRPYRYFTHPDLLTANGRGQTFLGVYLDDLKASGGSNSTPGTSLDEIIETTGWKKRIVEKYLQVYRQGYQSCSLKRFIGAAGKGASSSPTSFLQMMAVLRRERETQP